MFRISDVQRRTQERDCPASENCRLVNINTGEVFAQVRLRIEGPGAGHKSIFYFPEITSPIEIKLPANMVKISTRQTDRMEVFAQIAQIVEQEAINNGVHQLLNQIYPESLDLGKDLISCKTWRDLVSVTSNYPSETEPSYRLEILPTHSSLLLYELRGERWVKVASQPIGTI